MRPRGIQRATETSQERNRGPCFRSGLKVRIIRTKLLCGWTRHDYLKGRPADKSHLPLRNKLRGGVYIRSGV
jgi:hypothetical protein